VKFGVFLLVAGFAVALLGVCLIANGEVVLGCIALLVAATNITIGRELLDDWRGSRG